MTDLLRGSGANAIAEARVGAGAGAGAGAWASAGAGSVGAGAGAGPRAGTRELDADAIISALHAALSSFSPSAAAALSLDAVCLAHAAAARAPAPDGGAFVSTGDACCVPDAGADVATFRVDDLLAPRAGDDDTPLLREAADGLGVDAYEEALLAFFDDDAEGRLGRGASSADDAFDADEGARDDAGGGTGGGSNAGGSADGAAVFAWERGDSTKRARTE